MLVEVRIDRLIPHINSLVEVVMLVLWCCHYTLITQFTFAPIVIWWQSGLVVTRWSHLTYLLYVSSD